jgi:hypothetical protein
MATIRLPYAGPTTSLKSAKSRHYERRPLADFRLVVGPAYGSRMVAIQICADREDFLEFVFEIGSRKNPLLPGYSADKNRNSGELRKYS